MTSDRNWKRLLHTFGKSERANVAVIFAITLLPMLGAAGCAIDYATAAGIRSKLQSAADSASVGAISYNSAGYNAASVMIGNGTVAAGVTEANKIFNGNASTASGYTNLTVTSTVTKTGAALASSVSFSADVATTFMKALGQSKLTVSSSSSSAAQLPLYLDFYLTLDVSGSMGLPSTSAEAVRMQNINPDNYVQYPTGCTLACHFSPQNSACTDSGTQGYPTNNYCLGYAISRVSQSGYRNLLQNAGSSTPMGKKLPPTIVSGLPNSLYTNLATVANCSTDGTDSCIQLRLDAVGYAVNSLLATANTSAKITNQFRVGLYPFIRYLYSYFPLTSSINGSTTNPSTINYAAANLATLLDTNMDSNLGSGGTHIDTAITSVNSLILAVGDGSTSLTPLPYVFLVTDGAQDPQVKGVPNGGWSGSNHATTINPSVCTPLKNRGIIVSVLYIPYQVINPVNSSFAGDEDTYANNNIPNIPASLQGCASPGFFYTANTPADITTALNAMFNHAVAVARITN